MLFFDLTFTPDRVYLPFPEKHLFFFSHFLFIVSFLFYKVSSSFIHTATQASLGILQSPRGESATVPTFGPSGRQDLLNCWEKNSPAECLQPLQDRFPVVFPLKSTAGKTIDLCRLISKAKHKI